MSFLHLVFVLAIFRFCSAAPNFHKISARKLIESPCPLNFSALRSLAKDSPPRPAFIIAPSRCRCIPEGIRFLRSEYLRTNGYFSPPPDSYQACWKSYRGLMEEFLHGYDIETTCGYRPEWISETCVNITSKAQFESRFPKSALQEMGISCNQSLDNGFACDSCTRKLMSLGKVYLHIPDETDKVSNCSAYLFMYAAAFINQLGLTDPATARCLFRLDSDSAQLTAGAEKRHHQAVICGVVVGCIAGVSGASIAVWLFWMLHRKCVRKQTNPVVDENSLDLGYPNLVKFRIDEIRKATMNFSRQNLIGKGGYGNVYKGKLPDGSEVAFKRFKNCSAAGDATFAHEVEIIASVRHVNLVALRGYCTATVPMEGHQRIIVCHLMHNGSLYDHLFGSEMKKLSWPIRQKIAIGTARGLAYLHNGVHPAIIHRDIKASNILLDETFEPKVADFGLAKFNSQGMTHLSTRVAGTLGYVAPEYALYGKLTERSDVYSFGVVLLELLSGRKACENKEGKVCLLSDWAWSKVKERRALDVIGEDIPELGLAEVMEQYVHIAVICAHPLLHGRPTMDQVVNMLETNQQVSSNSRSFSAASCSDVTDSSASSSNVSKCHSSS